MEEIKKENTPLLRSSLSTEEPLKRRSYTFSYGSSGQHAPVDSLLIQQPGAQSNPTSTAASHCHERERDKRNEADVKARKTLIIASVLCLAFMVAEIVGGYLSSSLAIITDAAHLLTDFASFMISLFSLFLASRPATRKMSFGWHRAEVLGAVISVLMIWLITGVLVYMAIMRIVNQTFQVDGEIMLITASLGVAVNLLMGYILHRGGGHGHSHASGHSHSFNNKSDSINLTNVVEHSSEYYRNGPLIDTASSIEEEDKKIDVESGPAPDVIIEHSEEKSANINVRAAFIHVVGDFIQSLGVFVAALVIYFKPNLGIIDPICTFVFSLLVLLTTLAILRDALNVLMEGLPRGIDFVEVTESLLSLDGVERVHDLRIWSLTMDKSAVAVHLAVHADKDTQQVLNMAREVLRQRYNIYECTVQIEYFTDTMNECQRCEVPKA